MTQGYDQDALAAFVSASPIAIASLDREAHILHANEAFHTLMHGAFAERSETPLTNLVNPEQRQRLFDVIHTALVEHQRIADATPLELKLPDDTEITVSVFVSLVPGDTHTQLLAQFIDTTEQKNLEIKFAHSQKMQAVGQLAGGVAHDFNNLLTAMIGFCDLLLMRHPAGDQSFADIMQIKQNANRAANLVRQLLAFSRRQTLQPKLLEITDVLAELSNLVRRLIGENIELNMNHGRDMGSVRADQGQLEQVVINLAVNARDAMKDGGTLTIQSRNVSIKPNESPIGREFMAPSEEDADLPPGNYVLVEVADTGTGIPKELVQKIFEPFFSTKEVGSGTGLGLSTVYGIIKQSGGYIFVSSREGQGTTFHMYFPACVRQESTEPVAEQVERAPSMDLTGRNTILLVEDETPVRIFAARALGNKGYTVLEADCAETAIEIMSGPQGSEVELIITDVIMPGMNGPTMIEQIIPDHPNVKVIFISGYAEDVFVHSYGSERSFNFLAKPFTLKQLASKAKEVLQSNSIAA